MCHIKDGWFLWWAHQKKLPLGRNSSTKLIKVGGGVFAGVVVSFFSFFICACVWNQLPFAAPVCLIWTWFLNGEEGRGPAAWGGMNTVLGVLHSGDTRGIDSEGGRACVCERERDTQKRGNWKKVTSLLVLIWGSNLRLEPVVATQMHWGCCGSIWSSRKHVLAVLSSGSMF